MIPAAGSGSALSGALVLVSFGLGNVPALLGLALTFREVLGQARGRLRQVSALLLIATGALLVLQRGAMIAPGLPAAEAGRVGQASAAALSTDALPQVADQERLPCCGGGRAALDSGTAGSAAEGPGDRAESAR